MYLNNLSEQQKNLFIDICVHTANVDGNFSDDEKHLIKQFCEEMDIDVRYEANKSVDDAVDALLEISSQTELKIILIELISLILADNKFDRFEEQFMNRFTEKIRLSQDDYSEIFDTIKQLVSIYTKINLFIFED